jgi:glycosyltransferase involved in cell wall biosynthesis
MKNKLTVIIPSRNQEYKKVFIQRAVNSVRKQTCLENFDVTFLVGVDKDTSLDQTVSDTLGVICVESDGFSQAKALNGAIKLVNEGYVAFLEDDDQWTPDYLKFAMKAIVMCDFVSSTQAEFDENDELLRINDFPTPSGWFMPVTTLKMVGEFNEEYRFHLDNEYLGRLSEKKLKRIHMIESTAPIEKKYIRHIRPWLWRVIDQSAGCCQLARHQSPYPLVKRLVHAKSGMSQILSNSECSQISKQENKKLLRRFGREPW